MPSRKKNLHKSLTRLKTEVKDGCVYISCFLGTRILSSNADAGRGPEPVIQVYRKPADGFEFGVDYMEFFNGMNLRGARKIHDGPALVVRGRKLVCKDSDVEYGHTYAYWVRWPEDDAAVGPSGVRVRDPEVWWPFSRVDAKLTELARDFPDIVTLEQYGDTVQHRRLRGIRAGNRDISIALTGAIHAGEAGPELILPVIERILKQKPELLKRTGIAALPSVNADERERLVNGHPAYLRKNSNGVDLNRNFDSMWHEINTMYGQSTDDPESMTFRGPAPESELETQAVTAFMRAVKPAAVFTYHHLAGATYDGLLGPKRAAHDARFAQKCARFARPFVEGFGLRDAAGINYAASTGSFPSWAWTEFGVPCFDVERGPCPDADESARDRTTPEIIERCREYHFHAVVNVMEEVTG